MSWDPLERTVATTALVAALLVGSAASAEKPGQLQSTPLAALYGAPITLSSAALSPDGSKVAGIRTHDDGPTELIVRNFAESETSVILTRPAGGARLVECRWKSDARLLCSTKKPKEDSKRWLSLSPDGTRETDLGVFQKIIHPLPDQPTRILVRSNPPWYASAGVVDVETGSFRALPGNDKFGVLADGSGTIRVRYFLGQQKTVEGSALLPQPTDTWIVLHKRQLHMDWFYPVGFDERTNEVLYRDLIDGYLTLFAWDGHGEKRVVLAEPFAHVLGVEMIGKSPRAASAFVLDGQSRREPIDPRVTTVRDTVQQMYPRADVDVLEEDWNQRYYLVFVGDRQGAGTYFRFDSNAGRLDEFGSTFENLSNRIREPRTEVEFSTPDGRNARARVTRPPGAVGPLPAVVVPAGSSNWADNVVPFLVASGFVIVELPVEPLNYGQTIGSNWHAIAAEISASLRKLADAGTVDPDRVCIAGMELGGYVALMSATEMDLFRCVVGIDATIDPVVGDAMIVSLYHGARLSVPVLLLGETSDRRAVKLRGALMDHGAPAELVEYASEPFAATPERIDLLARLGAFLSANLR